MRFSIGPRIRIVGLLLAFLLAGFPLQAQPISRHQVLDAIAVLQKDITAPEALPAAVTVTRFGRESDAVVLIVGQETLPWVQSDVTEPQARVRALLMAAYFAGDIKAQLQKGRPGDEPYRGWLAAIRAYHQMQQKDPGVVVPELEILIREDKEGTLRRRAEEIVKKQHDEDQQQNQGKWI